MTFSLNRQILILVAFLLQGLFCYSQDTTFSKVLPYSQPTSLSDVEVLDSSFLYISTYYATNPNRTGVLFQKIDSLGNFQESTQITDSSENWTPLIGGVAVYKNFIYMVGFNVAAGIESALLVKLNENLDTVFVKQFYSKRLSKILATSV